MKALEHAKVELEKAQAAAVARGADLERLQKLTELYPDLERHVGRWGHTVDASARVNEVATHVFLRFNCGCCSDSPFEAWPYVKTEHGDVYTQPACFRVGEKHWIDGARPNDRWEQELRKCQISDQVIALVKERFEADRRSRIVMATEESPAVDEPDPFD